MKNILAIIALLILATSCLTKGEDTTYETNNFCSDKKALSIAKEALDEVIDGNYKITYISIKEDMMQPKSCLKYEYPYMSNTFKDYFVKDKYREGSKKEARSRIASQKADLKKMPAKRIGYIMQISGIAFDDNFSKRFSLSTHLDFEMMQYHNGSDWDYYRAYNTISEDSIHYYMNSRDVESALSGKYAEQDNLQIYFYD